MPSSVAVNVPLNRRKHSDEYTRTTRTMSTTKTEASSLSLSRLLVAHSSGAASVGGAGRSGLDSLLLLPLRHRAGDTKGHERTERPKSAQDAAAEVKGSRSYSSSTTTSSSRSNCVVVSLLPRTQPNPTHATARRAAPSPVCT